MSNQITLDGRTGAIGAGGVVDFGAPDLMNVNFYVKSVLDPIASRERGRPWHKAITYVRIQHPGEKDYVDRPVTDEDVAKVRWPRQWAAFERKQEQVPNGTPVDVIFPNEPEVAANMHSIAIHTAEQLAGLTANGLQTIGMGATQYQQRAKQFLDAARGGASLHRVNAENERLKNTVEVLENQLSALKGHVDILMAERVQGVPSAMVPTYRPTQAQAYAETQPAHYDAPEMSDEPLFVEVPDEVTGPSIPELHQELPKRRGRPPGSRNHQE